MSLSMYQAMADAHRCTCAISIAEGEHLTSCPCATHGAHVGGNVHIEDFLPERPAQKVFLTSPTIVMGVYALTTLVNDTSVMLELRQGAGYALDELAPLDINRHRVNFCHEVSEGVAYALQAAISYYLAQIAAELGTRLGVTPRVISSCCTGIRASYSAAGEIHMVTELLTDLLDSPFIPPSIRMDIEATRVGLVKIRPIIEQQTAGEPHLTAA